MGPLVLAKRVKFHYPSLSHSPEIPPEAFRGGQIDCFFSYNFRPEVGNDVISGMAVGNVGVDGPIKLGDSRSNGFRDIRGVDLMSNERTLEAHPIERHVIEF